MILKQWKVDSGHSSVGFSVRHMVISTVRGRFTRWSGSFVFAEAVPNASSVEVAIDAGSIDTGVPDRDAHLRSIDFLEAARHPLIMFRSTMVEPAGARQLTVTGDLTIRGITREVTLDVEYGGRVRDPLGKERVGFSARTTISRKDFGITFQQALANGSLVVGDKLEITMEIEALEQAARVLSPPAVAAGVL
jgi:polyisoprenoid-binding protein YceI